MEIRTSTLTDTNIYYLSIVQSLLLLLSSTKTTTQHAISIILVSLRLELWTQKERERQRLSKIHKVFKTERQRASTLHWLCRRWRRRRSSCLRMHPKYSISLSVVCITSSSSSMSATTRTGFSNNRVCFVQYSILFFCTRTHTSIHTANSSFRIWRAGILWVSTILHFEHQSHYALRMNQRWSCISSLSESIFHPQKLTRSSSSKSESSTRTKKDVTVCVLVCRFGSW